MWIITVFISQKKKKKSQGCSHEVGPTGRLVRGKGVLIFGAKGAVKSLDWF